MVARETFSMRGNRAGQRESFTSSEILHRSVKFNASKNYDNVTLKLEDGKTNVLQTQKYIKFFFIDISIKIK